MPALLHARAMISCHGYILRETEKAVLFAHDYPRYRPVWLPKSQINITRYEWSDTLKIPLWLAHKHNISPRPTPKEMAVLEGEINRGNELPNL